MSNRLTKKVIKERMIELRNLKTLNTAQAVTIGKLKEENKTLNTRVSILENLVKKFENVVSDVKSQLEAMKIMVFKKKRKAKDILDDDEPKQQKSPKAPRTVFHRPIPKESEVTETIKHEFPRNEDGTVDGTIRLVEYYVEDIPLNIKKTVTKHIVEQCFDAKRRTWISQSTLPSGKVVLGENIRMLVATLNIVNRLPYSQIEIILSTLFNIDISSGEITTILAKETTLLSTARDALLDSIHLEASQHMDETSYNVRGEKRYAWNIVGGTSGNTIYEVGRSRGKGVALELHTGSQGVLVSDDYAAYKHLTTYRQLCFAHPIRKFRDLSQSEAFSVAELTHIQGTYASLKAVHRDLKEVLTQEHPEKQLPYFTERLEIIAKVQDTDPQPVKRLKKTLKENISDYLTCLSFPLTALTNNLAERSLRHIVLKRKVSFGCMSEKGAQIASVLFSVLLSLFRSDPSTYFEKYRELRSVGV